MKNREKLVDAFHDIDDQYVEESKNPPKKRVLGVRLLAAVACFAVIVAAMPIAMFYFNRKESMETSPDSTDYISPLGWRLDSYENGLLQKSMETDRIRYVLQADCTQLSNLDEMDLIDDACIETFAQLYLSIFSFDYALHFPLFQEGAKRDSLYRVFDKEGVTEEEAVQKISEVAEDLIPFYYSRFSFSFLDIKVDDEEVRNDFFERHERCFKTWGLDWDKVESVVQYSLEDLKVYYNDQFYLELDEGYYDTCILYQYDGVWYADRALLDDDFSLDLLQSDKNDENDSYYKIKTEYGKITELNGRYFCVNDVDYYAVKDESVLNNIKIGDIVKVEFHALKAKGLLRISDHKKCTFGSAVNVEKDSEWMSYE